MEMKDALSKVEMLKKGMDICDTSNACNDGFRSFVEGQIAMFTQMCKLIDQALDINAIDLTTACGYKTNVVLMLADLDRINDAFEKNLDDLYGASMKRVKG